MANAACRVILAIGLALACAAVLRCSPDDSELDSTSSGVKPSRYIVKYWDHAGALDALDAVKAKVDLPLLPQRAVAARIPEWALGDLKQHPHIEYIEPDPLVYMHAETVPYGITMVQADITPVPSRIDPNGKKVCIIDSGILASHEDLQKSHIDGISLVRGEAYNTETGGHGTHVAGTIAAIGNNELGVVGVLPNGVDLYIVKVFPNAGGSAYSSSILGGVNKCASVGAKVVNMSLGGGYPTKTAKQTYEDAYENYGMLILASAGNDGDSAKGYPASYPSVVSVGAVDMFKERASFSQFNDAVEIAAPGVAVRSTVPWGNVLKVDGESFDARGLSGGGQGSASGEIMDGRKCQGMGAWTDKVVICQRGDIPFRDKVMNVQKSGGAAAVIYNNKPGSFSGTLGEGPPATIPVIALSQDDGAFLLANMLGKTGEVMSDIGISGYGEMSGTSMAAPHATGVAALVWSKFPDKTNKEIRQALTKSAEDLGRKGRDSHFGFGLIQAQAAINYLSQGGSGAVCGNDIQEGGEVCDGTDLGGKTCPSGPTGSPDGTLVCLADCSGFDTSGCGSSGQSTCGDRPSGALCTTDEQCASCICLSVTETGRFRCQ